MDAGRTGIDGVDGRRVVILCGPPGAGKTTAARASGLTVFDRDDPQWQSERQFTDALRALGRDPSAQAVVIRSGASSSARARWSRMVAATHVFMVMASPAECVRRVRERGRDDLRSGVAAVPRWFESFDDRDGVRLFPGWDALGEGGGLSLGASSRAW